LLLVCQEKIMKLTKKPFAVGLGTTALLCALGTAASANLTPQASTAPGETTLTLLAQDQQQVAQAEPEQPTVPTPEQPTVPTPEQPIAPTPEQPIAPIASARYRMTDRWLSLTDTYVIRNSGGEPVFTIDGRLISLNGQMVFKDMSGRELATIENKIFDIIDTIQIKRDRQVVAEVRPAIISPLRQSYILDVPGIGEGVAQGDFINHEYEIRGRDSDRLLARITRRYLSLQNAYDIEIFSLTRDVRIEDDVLFIATAAAIDLLEGTDDGVSAAPPVPVVPLPVVTCSGRISASDLDFTVPFIPDTDVSTIDFTRDGVSVATADLEKIGSNSLNQGVWRGAANGTTDVILTHQSDQTVREGDEVAVVYDGQSGSGSCSFNDDSGVPTAGTFAGRGDASGSVFERSQSVDATLNFSQDDFSLSLAVPSGTGNEVFYRGVITQRESTGTNSFQLETQVQSFASSANNLQAMDTDGSCRIEVFDSRVTAALCNVDVLDGNTQFTGMAEF
jgi:uncharacterized protein YxjI